MPTNSDLVTDLPADFEVFGQGVDTTLADLKGGTTGQILSKATNADMDFTWTNLNPGDITGVTATSPLTGGGTSGDVTIGIQSASTTQSGAVQLTDSTSSTSTTTAATPNSVKSAYDLANTANSTANAAIPKSTVTAKGSIVAASAASTPTNLSVGADFAFLKADSSQSTGLAWDNAAWTSWTPTITANSGTFTTVSSFGTYKRIGKVCFVRQTITITTNGTAAGTVNSTLPFTGVSQIFTGVFREDQSTGNLGQISISSTSAVFRKSDNTYPGGSGYRFEASYFYEVA